MAADDSRRRTVPYAVLGGVLVLAALVLLLRSRPPSPPAPAPVASLPAEKTNPPAAPTPAPKGLSPDVAALVKLMQDWRQKNPVYHLLVESSGTELVSQSEVYRFLDDKGEWKAGLKNQVSKPVPLDYVVQADKQHIRAYFPHSNKVIEMATEKESIKALVQLGWTGGQIDVTTLLGLAETSFVETGPDFKALTMVFSGKVFRLPSLAKDVFVTIKLDEQGKALGMEQLTLGQRIISKITYFADPPPEIAQNAPRIPATATPVEKSFEDAVQEEIALTMNKPTKTI